MANIEKKLYVVVNVSKIEISKAIHNYKLIYQQVYQELLEAVKFKWITPEQAQVIYVNLVNKRIAKRSGWNYVKFKA